MPVEGWTCISFVLRYKCRGRALAPTALHFPFVTLAKLHFGVEDEPNEEREEVALKS